MTTRLLRGAALLAVALLLGAGSVPPPEPQGYRTEKYDSPTPLTLNGMPALTTAQVAKLWRSKQALFIDEVARPPRPPGLPVGTLWHPVPRLDIPGSVWLPDTGYGELPAATAAYFSDALKRATDGDRGRPLIFYCKAHCWMSWNAAKRAEALGYENVGWYRAGTSGWSTDGLPLAPAQPVPGWAGANPRP